MGERQVVEGDAAELARAAGDGLVRIGACWRMRAAPIPAGAPSWPVGVRVRGYDDRRDAAALHALLERSYGELHRTLGGNWAEEEPVEPFDEWHAWMTSQADFEPGLWRLAERDGRLVGACLTWAEPFVKDLVVDPGERRAGLGEALLRDAFELHRARGARSIELKVDEGNERAERLYRRVGMQRVHRILLFAPPPAGPA